MSQFDTIYLHRHYYSLGLQVNPSCLPLISDTRDDQSIKRMHLQRREHTTQITGMKCFVIAHGFKGGSCSDDRLQDASYSYAVQLQVQSQSQTHSAVSLSILTFNSVA